MYFKYSEKSTYEKKFGDSANDKVEVYKSIKFDDGTEIAFVNNNGSFDNGYDSDGNYNPAKDNFIYWDEMLVPNGRSVLLRTFKKLECWEEETFKFKDEKITNPELFSRMLDFFKKIYETVSIDNTISI